MRQLPPPEHTFRVIAPERWSGGDLAPVPVGTDWWTYFGNAELERLVAEALEGNHDLRAAAARIEAHPRVPTPDRQRGGVTKPTYAFRSR